jgi:DNA-binding transcriptional LysR family regulator
MVDQVRDIIERIESLGADPVFDPTTETRQFSIVARDLAQVVLIAPLVSILESRFPHFSVAIVPKSLVKHSSFVLKAFKMPIDFPQIEIALLWHKRVQKDPGNAWLRDQLLEVCKTTR